MEPLLQRDPKIRKWNSLMQRFKKKIAPDVMKWLAIKRSNKLPSGADIIDTWYKDLDEQFRMKHNKPFSFGDCLDTLREIQKFDPDASPFVDIEEVEDGSHGIPSSVVTSSFSSPANKLQRPIGTKKCQEGREGLQSLPSQDKRDWELVP